MVYLWALSTDHTQAYPIAKLENGIYLYEADFSVGSVISLFVNALDSYTIQTFTRYAVQFKTVDPIPNSSRIKVRFPDTITLTEGVCALTSATAPISLSA